MKNKINLYIALGIAALIFIILAAFAWISADQNFGLARICVANACIKAEVAVDKAQRMQGLMYRQELADDSGMLFVFGEPDYYYFWMKNTLIPLDMIWLNQDREIVDINQADPCQQDDCPRYFPREKARYVIEVNQGFSQENNWQIGDQVEIEF